MGWASTRLSVRRLCSPLIESNPSAIAASGRKNPRNATNEGSGSCDVVNSFKYRKGSSATEAFNCRTALKVAPKAVRKISPSSNCMRTLLRWSASSLRTTAQSPVQGEPSRFTMHLLEVPRVNLVQGWALQRQRQEIRALADDAAGHLGPAIDLGL